MQWPDRGKGAPSLVFPCPGSDQVQQVLPVGTTGRKVLSRASHAGESLETEFVEKTGQSQGVVRQEYWSACLHATLPDYSFFLNIS